jgi:hypothetical protein
MDEPPGRRLQIERPRAARRHPTCPTGPLCLGKAESATSFRTSSSFFRKVRASPAAHGYGMVTWRTSRPDGARTGAATFLDLLPGKRSVAGRPSGRGAPPPGWPARRPRLCPRGHRAVHHRRHPYWGAARDPHFRVRFDAGSRTRNHLPGPGSGGEHRTRHLLPRHPPARMAQHRDRPAVHLRPTVPRLQDLSEAGSCCKWSVSSQRPNRRAIHRNPAPGRRDQSHPDHAVSSRRRASNPIGRSTRVTPQPRSTRAGAGPSGTCHQT